MYVSNEREKAICHKVSQGLLSEIVGSPCYNKFTWYNFYYYIFVVLLSLCFGDFPVGWFDSMSISMQTFVE